MDLARLLALQEIDTTVDRLAARSQVLESGGELAAARNEADAAERALGELRLQLDVVGRDGSKLEHEIDSLSQKAAAEDKRLYDGSVVNAKELGSIQHEIDNLKRRRSDREDEMLGLMEVREELERRAAEAQATSDALSERVETVGGAALEELTSIESELEARLARRQILVPEIEPDILDLYEDLRKQKKGIGAAALVDGVCQGCHEQLSAMELDKLKRVEGVRRCEHCRRILIF
ncbi:MAG: zinc ribbon domain-containing protein [Actinomycetota bacterium]